MMFRRSKDNRIDQDQQDEKQQELLSSDLDQNLQLLRSLYTDCSDVVFRPFLIGGQIQAELIYIEGLSNVQEMDINVLSPLMHEAKRRATAAYRMAEGNSICFKGNRSENLG
ncbi:hypothetical protein GCM10020331_026320 [Ectobacillus funiculus]